MEPPKLDRQHFQDFWPLVGQHPPIVLHCAPADAVAVILQLRVAASMGAEGGEWTRSARLVADRMQQQFCGPVSLMLDRLSETSADAFEGLRPAPAAALVKSPTSGEVVRFVAVLLVALAARWAAVCRCRRLARWLLRRSAAIGKTIPSVRVMEFTDAR